MEEIHLSWIYYAVYEELHCNDNERARQVYKACLDIIPHKKFTFAKIWLLYANFEIRQQNLNKAREILVSTLVFAVQYEGKILA